MTEGIIDATPEQVMAVVEQMPDLPWPEGEQWLEWTIDGLEGQTSFLMHVLPLASDADAAALASYTAQLRALADRRWPARHRFDAARFTDDAATDHAATEHAATDHAAYDRRSAPASLVRSLGAVDAAWWRFGSDAVMLIDSSASGPEDTKAAVLVLSAQWLEGPEPAGAAAPAAASLVEDFLSRDGRRVLHAVWEVIATRDPAVLAPLAARVASIDHATDDLELGGMLASNGANLQHAIDRIGIFGQRRCLCAAYAGHQFYDPAKEQARGHVRIVREDAVFVDGRPDRPKRICECADCGQWFSVEEGEYHYTWWKWTPMRAQVPAPESDSPIDVALWVLAYPWTAADDLAARRPPYPVPGALAPRLAQLVAALPAGSTDRARPASTVDTGRLLRHERRPYASGADNWSRARFVNRLPRVVLHLIAHGVLTIEDGQRLVEATAGSDPLVAARLRQQLLRVHLEQGDLPAAAAAAEQMGAYAADGWRDIGFHHADRGQTAQLLGLWARYNSRGDRVDLEHMKQALVSNVARIDGWQAAVALCGSERRIGGSCLPDAFASRHPWQWPPLHTVEELLQLFAGGAAGVLDPIDELTCLVDAVRQETPEPPLADHPAVPGLLDRIIALDWAQSKAAMRARDLLLSNLWMALGDKASLDRMVKAVRAPRLRADLRQGLPRDTGRRPQAPAS